MTLLEANSEAVEADNKKVDPGEMGDLFAQAQAERVESPQLKLVRAEIAAEVPEAQQIPVSTAERLMRAETPRVIGREFAEGVALTFDAARTVGELKERARVYLATNNESTESSTAGDEGLKGYLVETEDGWYRPLPGESRAQVVMNELNAARQKLQQRSAVESATARVSKAFEGVKDRAKTELEVHSERKEQKAVAKEYDAFDKEMDKLRAERKQQETVRAEAKIEADRRDAEIKGRELGEARRKMARAETGEARAADTKARLAEKAMLQLPALSDQIREARADVRSPYNQQIEDLESRHAEALILAEKRGILSPDKRYDIDQKYATERSRLYSEGSNLANLAEQKVRAEYKAYEDTSLEQIEQLLDFESSENPAPHIFKPSADLTPEGAAVIAGANSEMMGKMTPPQQVDEYKLGDSVMQRMVFLTADSRTVIVEDWDKSSGKLKRQVVIKGDKLLIPDYENEGLGRMRSARRRRSGKSREVLNDEVYAKLGLIDKADVSGDSGTSYQEGYSLYTQNLVRSGGGNIRSAQEFARHSYKPKKNKGFIALLTEGLVKGKKPKK